MNNSRARIGRWLWACIAISIAMAAGCSRTEPSGGQCFRWSTGLDLPPGVSCDKSKTITVAFVGDTYYVKLHAKQDVSAFLDKNFSSASWENVRDSMTPPKDWMKSLPFWDLAAIAGKAYYEKTYRNDRGTTFVSALSYDKGSGEIYFVSSEAGGCLATNYPPATADGGSASA